jgi:hypothetical protein
MKNRTHLFASIAIAILLQAFMAWCTNISSLRWLFGVFCSPGIYIALFMGVELHSWSIYWFFVPMAINVFLYFCILYLIPRKILAFIHNRIIAKGKYHSLKDD